MDPAGARRWFDDYLTVFAALGRGELDDPRLLLDYYAVPLLLTTDDAVTALVTEDAVMNAVEQQIRGLRETGYDRSEVVASELSDLNDRTALHAAEFVRRRADGTEIGRLAATYLITVGAAGPRISAIVIR